ncbi:DUF3857 domain-containing protein [uncultured Psychroserpens sp.]|uniref:DUF3857 domain-containing protein n=1 Tax=uncultured Psychroserpens sp. TaxID=255436 RepID=UPI00260FA2EB|nr:DUF3857 domain-containing protein [uncultured Psychroserpens sp.]
MDTNKTVMRRGIYLIIILISLSTYSQNFEFGKVSKEELVEKFNPKDSSANATYLLKFRRTFKEETEVFERIKIYNKEGFDYATKVIKLYRNGKDKEKLKGFEAYTHNLVDGEIKRTKLNDSGIFETELSERITETKVTLPDIKEGCVIEYQYLINSPFVADEFVLQKEVPIKHLKVKFEAPRYYKYKLNLKGYIDINPTTIVRKDYSEDVLITTITLNNVPALKDEPYVNNIDNYRASAEFELSSIEYNGQKQNFSKTWFDVVKNIYASENFGEELKKNNYFKSNLKTLLLNVEDPTEKAKLIFSHVKSHMKWNGYVGKFTDQGVKNAYKVRVGNAAEINLMLTAMLRDAGLNANPVLVSTRNNGIPIAATRHGYNYVICIIESPSGNILLDATSKYSTFNILPFRALNWEGRIIREQGSATTTNLYPKVKAKTTVFMNVKLKEDGSVTGKIRNMKTNHNAMNFREAYINRNQDNYLESMENRYGGIEVSDFKVTNDLDLSKPVITNYNFEAEEQFESIGDKLYVSPMFFFASEENPFKSETREFPVDFGYPSGSKYSINIAIPEGYKVESVPEVLELKLPDGLGTFKYNITTNDTNIQLSVDSYINAAIIAPSYYKSLKEYFKLLIEKEKEKVVLTKI